MTPRQWFDLIGWACLLITLATPLAGCDAPPTLVLTCEPHRPDR